MHAMEPFHLVSISSLLLHYYTLVVLVILFIHAPFAASLLSFNFNFSTSDYASELNYSNDSYWAKPVVELTKDHRYGGINGSVGRVWYAQQVPLWDHATGELASFDTTFSFQIITHGNDTAVGDGMAFFLSYYPSVTPTNSAGGGLGLFSKDSRTSNDITAASASGDERLVAVEFDTYPNPEWDSNDNDHVGIDVNSIYSVVSKQTDMPGKDLSSGRLMTARVSYHNDTRLLAVDLQIDDALYHISTNVDLRDKLPETVAVGFSASTGDSVELHQLLSWSFNSTDLGARKTETAAAPAEARDDAKSPNKQLSPERLACLIAVGLAVVGVFFFISCCFRKALRWCKRHGREKQCCGPKQYQYHELVKATNRFDQQRRLGRGGSGEVYLGDDNGRQVAVKKLLISPQMTIGEAQRKRSEFEAEVRIISRMRHKNLVRLIGWCDRSSGLLVVYKFIPGGSLDKHLYHSESSLTWNDRYRIIIGLGKAIGYLHGEHSGTKYVVHGDIKPSNIMLDEELNAKLGDFGVARLVSQGAEPRTTQNISGTHGYIEPEYRVTGKICKESDIYSFGIVLLEIVTGRRPTVELFRARVWQLYGQDRVVEAASGTLLRSESSDQQIERVLVVGLWCTQHARSERPSIAEAMRVLENADVQLPVLTSCPSNQMMVLSAVGESQELGRTSPILGELDPLAPAHMYSITAPVATVGEQDYSGAHVSEAWTSAQASSTTNSTSYTTCSSGAPATTSLGVELAPTWGNMRGN